jgi:hypothetical protein
VEELRLVCEQLLTADARLTLDTREVSFMDEDGIALLECLEGRQVSFVDACEKRSAFSLGREKKVSPPRAEC